MKNAFITLAFTVFSSVSSAGVITGGGGGLINPRATTTRDVVEAIRRSNILILESWVQRQQMDFDLLNPQSQASSPVRKLFAPGAKFIELIESTPIEIHDQSACPDAEGKPFDGSIYAQHAGAVCISSFTTAPRLTPYNVEAEILALLLHEYTHLVGTTEDEAVAIQTLALDDFSRIRTDEIRRQLRVSIFKMGGTEGTKEKLSPLRTVAAQYDYASFTAAAAMVTESLDALITDDGHFAFADRAQLDLADQIKAELLVAVIGVCALDPQQSSVTRAKCQTDLDTLFAKRAFVLSSEVLVAEDIGDVCRQLPDFCFAKGEPISKPLAATDIAGLSKKIMKQVEEIKTRLFRLSNYNAHLI